MKNTWKAMLPKEYLELVIEPMFFESIMAPMTNSVKYIGFDAHARHCFYYHSSILTMKNTAVEEIHLFDSISYEREIAWRLCHGEWLKIKSSTGWLNQFQSYISKVPLEAMREVLS
jgi:hypothetical protein